MRQYYYLNLAGEFVVIVARPDTDRVGLMGAAFATENLAATFVETLNEEEKADKEAEGS